MGGGTKSGEGGRQSRAGVRFGECICVPTVQAAALSIRVLVLCLESRSLCCVLMASVHSFVFQIQDLVPGQRQYVGCC